MLSFERLTARNKDGIAYLVNVKADEQEVNSPYKNTLKCILDCFERLAQYEDEAIARQSVESEEVQRAIEFMKKEMKMLGNWVDRTGDCFDEKLAMFKTIPTALQAYQPKEPCERASLVASGSVYQVLTCSNCGAVFNEIKFTEPPKGE